MWLVIKAIKSIASRIKNNLTKKDKYLTFIWENIIKRVKKRDKITINIDTESISNKNRPLDSIVLTVAPVIIKTPKLINIKTFNGTVIIALSRNKKKIIFNMLIQ